MAARRPPAAPRNRSVRTRHRAGIVLAGAARRRDRRGRKLGPADGAQEVVRADPMEGSNNWAIAGSRTASGRPIMASDPHRAHAAPSLRYLVHQTAPGVDVIGAGEPSSTGSLQRPVAGTGTCWPNGKPQRPTPRDRPAFNAAGISPGSFPTLHLIPGRCRSTAAARREPVRRAPCRRAGRSRRPCRSARL